MAQVHSPSATEAHHAHALEGANVSWCFVVLVGKLPRVFKWDEMLDVFFLGGVFQCQVPPAINQFNMAIDKNQVGA